MKGGNVYKENKVKIIQWGEDGFGHQLEGVIRLISLSLNNKADYQYNYKKTYKFEHSNYDAKKLEEYFNSALHILSIKTHHKDHGNYEVAYKDNKPIRENRTFKEIIDTDPKYKENIYVYDGVGNGEFLPPNFESKEEMEKSLPALREAFVEKNTHLPKPSYDNKFTNVCCHIRLGDALGSRKLDNDKIFETIKHFQKKNSEYYVIIHTNGDVDHLKAEHTIIHDGKTDVLQVLSDFIHADILILANSSLSVAAHLLANANQKAICPVEACNSFHDRVLGKCLRSDKFLESL